MVLSRKHRFRAARRWSESLDGLYDYSRPPEQRSSNHPPVEPIRVTDDWLETVPIGDAELRVIEGHLRDDLDALFGPLP